jgi:hypothetical protein
MQITLLVIFIGMSNYGKHDELESIVHNILIAIELGSAELIVERVKTWNEFLRTQTIESGSSSKEVTLVLLSACRMLTDVLGDPLEYDFSEGGATDEVAFG